MKAITSESPPITNRSADYERPITVSVETVCKLTSLGPSNVWKLIRTGRLKTVKLGHRTLVLFDSVEQLLGVGRGGV